MKRSVVVTVIALFSGSVLSMGHAADTGYIEGRVRDSENNPLTGICVGFFYRSLEGGWSQSGFSSAVTDGAGDYQSAALPVGSYNVAFGGTAESNQCDFNIMANYAEQWWDHKPGLGCSDALPVTTGEPVVGIDATLGISTICPPDPPAIATDLAVTNLEIVKVPIETDHGELVYSGWVRDITVEVVNHSAALTYGALLKISACTQNSITPAQSGCSIVVQDSLNLSAGGTLQKTYRWSAHAWIGDVTLTATIDVPFDFIDTNLSNNRRSANTYVIVGGTGIGTR